MNFKFQISDFKFRSAVLLFTFTFLLFTFGCSIPNLESPECTAARTPVRQFYSFHIGNEMKPSAENLQLREKFLSAELRQELAKQGETDVDYFTQTADYPKTFRVGECQAVSPEKTVFQVVLFWKDENRNEQREINVEAVKQNESWLINKIESK